MNPYLLKFIKYYINTGSALDFGCGKGKDVRELKKLGWEVEGYDLPKVDLNLPLIYYKEVDVIYSNYVLPFIKEKEVFVSNIYNNLKEGGEVLICTFRQSDGQVGQLASSKKELKKLFSKFKDIKIEEDDIWDDDHGHGHEHCLYILTARK